MRLHVELATNTWIAVDYQIIDAEFLQLLATGQTRWAGTNDGHGGLIDSQCIFRLRFGRSIKSNTRQVGLMGDDTHLLDPVDGRDADTAYSAVDQHFAGATLADATFQRAVTTLQRMAMHREARLV